MKRFNNFFRLLLFFVASLHFVGLIKNSFIEFEELETFRIELSDSDSNESESEEIEEEDLLNFDFSRGYKSKNHPDINNTSRINLLIYQFKIKSQTQTVLESPPELELS